MPDMPQADRSEQEGIVTIQRYGALNGAQIRAQQEGLLVLYSDHVAAVAEAAGLRLDNLREGYEQGQRDALAGAVQRVDFVTVHIVDVAEQGRPDIRDMVELHKVKAAIKGTSDE